MAVHDFNALGSFQDRGCIACGEGALYSADQVLGVAETFSKRILSKTVESWEGPSFDIKRVPTKASMAVQTNAFSNRMSIFYANLERQKFYDPRPTLHTNQVTKELIDKSGGIDGIEYNFFDASGIACNPPLGSRALAGKDAAYSTEVWVPFQIGPICTGAKYRVLEDLIMYFDAAEAALAQALDVSVQYEKINQFVQMSRKNASAVAGTWEPKFTSHAISEMPNSHGSLEWITYTAGQIGSRFPGLGPVRVGCSLQLLKFWIEDYVARKENIVINIDFKTIQGSVRENQMSFTSEGQFAWRDVRTGRQIIFDTTKTPIYQLLTKRGQSDWESRHQPYFVYRPGDDTRDGEQNGIMQDPNPHLGDADQIHEDGSVLAELILIYNDDAFHYESPPRNPFAGKFGEGSIMPTIGTTQIQWFTGSDVDLYFLKYMADPATGICPNNMARQWLAGWASQHVVIRENNKYAMGSILVRVPTQSTPLGTATGPNLAQTARPAPIELTTAAPIPADLCETAGEAPDAVPGCLQVQMVLNAFAQASGNKTYKLTVERVGGFDGSITVDYETVAGTAHAGTHFTALSGTLTFAAGERVKQVDLVILPFLAESEEDADPVAFQVLWDGDLCNPFGGVDGYEDDSETDVVTNVTVYPAKPAAE